MKILRTSWVRRLGHYMQIYSISKNSACGSCMFKYISYSKNKRWFSNTKNMTEYYCSKETWYKNIW